MTKYGELIGGIGAGIGGLGLAVTAALRLSGRARYWLALTISVLSVLVIALAVGLLLVN